MDCCNCHISVQKAMLHRTNPLGQSDAGFMCLPCIQKLHPELAANIKADCDEAPIISDLHEIFYAKPLR